MLKKHQKSEGNSSFSEMLSSCLKCFFDRFLVAARDIKAEEVIIDDEPPIVVGPKQATYPVCLACYRRVDGSYECSRCQWPLCSEGCEHSSSMHSIECGVLASQQIKPKPKDLELEDCKIYDCIAPLRLLLEARSKPDTAQLFDALEHHECHRKRTGIWTADQVSVVHPLCGKWGLKDKLDERQLQRACGILEVNAFEVSDEDEGINARAVFGAACLMAHNCVPNTACYVEPLTQRMTVKAAVDIAAGDMITTSYTFTLDGTQRRRAHLKETKFFDCVCQRCTDPAELGTHLSSLVCPKCNGQHFAVPEDPLDEKTFWKCTDEQCGFEISSANVHKLLECLQKKADALNYDDVDGLESFIDSWTPVLHPNHSILVGVKYYLCHFYGNAPGFSLDELTPQTLERKVQLCEELLTVARILEPGSSRLQRKAKLKYL